jgi:hypothetical protein
MTITTYLLLSIASYALYRTLSSIQGQRSDIWYGIEKNLFHHKHHVAILRNLAWPIYVPLYIGEFIWNYLTYTGESYDRTVVTKMVKKFGKVKTREYLKVLLDTIPSHVEDLVDIKYR